MLGGYSVGGIIAFEMAQQLSQQHEEIDLLFLLEAGPFGYPDYLPPREDDPGKTLTWHLSYHWEKLNRLTFLQQTAYLVKRIPYRLHVILSLSIGNICHNFGYPIPDFCRFHFVRRTYMKFLKKHVLSTTLYPGRVVFCHAEDPCTESIAALRKTVSGTLEVYRISETSNHFALIKEANIPLWAKYLKHVLDNVDE
ncbi:MAG: hypothetical protein GY801_39520 [bacterium]|nr:hypothetical protein [bacterium]